MIWHNSILVGKCSGKILYKGEIAGCCFFPTGISCLILVKSAWFMNDRLLSNKTYSVYALVYHTWFAVLGNLSLRKYLGPVGTYKFMISIGIGWKVSPIELLQKNEEFFSTYWLYTNFMEVSITFSFMKAKNIFIFFNEIYNKKKNTNVMAITRDITLAVSYKSTRMNHLALTKRPSSQMWKILSWSFANAPFDNRAFKVERKPVDVKV